MEDKLKQTDDGYTTISIKFDTWQRLIRVKVYPSQTFDTIINNLLDSKEVK